ncbi:uncharacterized protein LOC142521918 [Primulina tabacum]|uniref:uncharacterized protein LOC142521918 n=1 Tax=Primulina tabacum TaxID=48773 RepID=UPI003F5ACB33
MLAIVSSATTYYARRYVLEFYSNLLSSARDEISVKFGRVIFKHIDEELSDAGEQLKIVPAYFNGNRKVSITRHSLGDPKPRVQFSTLHLILDIPRLHKLYAFPHFSPPPSPSFVGFWLPPLQLPAAKLFSSTIFVCFLLSPTPSYRRCSLFSRLLRAGGVLTPLRLSSPPSLPPCSTQSPTKIFIRRRKRSLQNSNKQNMRMALYWLFQGCQPGDSLVFHYSGHGSRQRNYNGDEVDGYDETLCPLDFETQGMIVDDEINTSIVRPLPHGVKLHAIIDACHSGTVLDLPFLCRMNRSGQYAWEDHRTRSGVWKGTNGGEVLSRSGWNMRFMCG